MASLRASPRSARNGGHVAMHAVSVGLAVAAQLILDVFFVIANNSCTPNALFQNSLRNVSESFSLEVTMDWWSTSYWIMIDLWSKAWLLSSVIGLFKRNVLGPVSCNPEIHDPTFYLIWTVINLARVCTFFLWDRHDILGAVTLGWIRSALSFYMLYISYSNLDKHKAWLAINSPSVISWTRYLTQNGLAAFAWWSLLNALVGFGVVLKYAAGFPDPPVSSVVLTLVFLCAVAWFTLQSFVWTRYLQQTFSVYPVLVLGLGAMFTRSYRVHDLAANTIYCGFLMLLMTVLSLGHLVSECLRTDKSIRPAAPGQDVTSVGCVTVHQPEAIVQHKLHK